MTEGGALPPGVGGFLHWPLAPTFHPKAHPNMSDSYERQADEATGDWYERLRTEREQIDEYFREAKRAMRDRSKEEREAEEAAAKVPIEAEAAPDDLSGLDMCQP